MDGHFIWRDMNNKKNPFRMEREQKKIDAGTIAAQYPEVLNIIVNMIYSQKGISNKLNRTMHYSSDSYAYFYVACLNKECGDGGFDFNHVIKSMIRNNKEVSTGKLSCNNSELPIDHSDISYQILIKYA